MNKDAEPMPPIPMVPDIPIETQTTAKHWPKPIAVVLDAYKKLSSTMEKRLPILTVAAFIFGILISKYIPAFSDAVNTGVSKFIDFYGYVAPLAIYFILAPSLARIINSGKGSGGKFAGFAVLWLSLRRLASLFFAVAFTGLVFGMPLVSPGHTNVMQSILQTIKSLGWMMTHSTYFFAMYAAVITVAVSTKWHRIERYMNACASGIEVFGQASVPLVPLFMLAIGSYVYGLPQNLAGQLGNGIHTIHLHPLRFLGISIDPSTSTGMIMVYIVGSVLTGICCMIWHCGLLAQCKVIVKEFSVVRYFRDYWIRVYPLLWSTSSESLATPLNLYLVKKYYPEIRTEVRRFVLGVGSYIDINGTMICVIVLMGVVASLLGIQLSWVQLALCIPLVFLIGFGVPGIPGELLLFGGPLVMLLNFPEQVGNAFLALYLGLQLGLPDSFRTGNNSTDSCVLALLINKIYIKKFGGQETPEEQD